MLIGALQPPWRVANLSMLYLIGVLATATLAGRGPAILVSVIAFLVFNLVLRRTASHPHGRRSE